MDEPTDEPGVSYTMANRDGRTAAGMMQLSPQMAESGMPPVWTTCVSVVDLEQSVALVEPAGGTVLQPPMSVMDAGRMAVIADPSGAVFALWEAAAHIGAEVVNEAGALVWNELTTPEPTEVLPFYEAVLGWTTEVTPMPEGEYFVFHVTGGNEQGIAGAMAPPMPGMPPFWSVYFQVDDVEATVAKASELGAQVLMEATEMEMVGTLAVMSDPQGAVFSLMAPEN